MNRAEKKKKKRNLYSMYMYKSPKNRADPGGLHALRCLRNSRQPSQLRVDGRSIGTFETDSLSHCEYVVTFVILVG